MRFRRRLTIFTALILLATSLTLMIRTINYRDRDGKVYTLYPVDELIARPPNHDMVVILDWSAESHVDMKQKQQCPETAQRCIVTADRLYETSADALIFYMGAMRDNPKDRPRAEIRRAKQKYILANSESPTNRWIDYSLLNDWGKYFNWTMSYRRDADVFYPYLTFRRREESQEGWREHVLKEMGNQRNENHTAPSIVWMASNCEAASNRFTVVKSLQKHIAIDVYGKCGDKNCSSYYDGPVNYEKSECDDIIRKNYKFYLAFENSICTDYVTEKFARAVLSYTIPIVLSDRIYRQWAPSNSYIALDRFSNILELTKHLQYLLHNETAYLEYFAWQRDYAMVGKYPYFCHLCDKVRRERNLTFKVDDVYEWSVGNVHNDCDNNGVIHSAEWNAESPLWYGVKEMFSF